jgi:hypothetical protein
VTRGLLPALGYAYVALALPAFLLGFHHSNADSALFTGAIFAFLWFLASLHARLVRYDPNGFYASVVVAGGAAVIALQAATVMFGQPQFAALGSACAATVIIGSSLGALRARKVSKWFGRAGVAGGVVVLVIGIVEGATDWTFAGDDLYASVLGFMVWVVVTATYLLTR